VFTFIKDGEAFTHQREFTMKKYSSTKCAISRWPWRWLWHSASCICLDRNVNAYACYTSMSLDPHNRTVVGGGGSSLNPWPVVMIGVGVASIIACAMIVGSEEGRELTLG
jgi:hypothetical protein